MGLPRGLCSVRAAWGRATPAERRIALAERTRSARIVSVGLAALVVACPLGLAPGAPAAEGGTPPAAEGGTPPSVNEGQGPQVTETHKLPLGLAVALVGETLLCASGSWTGTPPPTFTYRWLREGVAIAGATEASYKVQAADEGHGLLCEVTATNSAGSKSATSALLKVLMSGSGLGGPAGGGELPPTGEQESTEEQTPPGGRAPGGVGSHEGGQGAQVAVSGAITTRARAVSVVLHCAPAGACSAVTVQLVVVERLHDGHVVGVAASGRQTVKRTVVIGSTTVTIAAGRSRTVEVPLSPTSRRLEVRDGKLAAQVRVISEGHVLTTRKVQIRALEESHDASDQMWKVGSRC
jgi:hypothetical protein